MGAGASVDQGAFRAVRAEYDQGCPSAEAVEGVDPDVAQFRALKAKYEAATAAAAAAPPADPEKTARSDYFARTPLSAFEAPPQGQVAVIMSSASVAEAAQTLNSGNFMAAPVLKEGVDKLAHWAEAFVGVVDVVRIVKHVVDLVSDEEKGFEEQLSFNACFREVNVEAVTAAGEAAPFLPLTESASLLDAMVLLGQYHVPRIPIIDAHGELVNIITRSSVVREAAERFKEGHEVFASIKTKTIGELGLGTSPVMTVTTGDPVKAVLQMIIDAGVTGVGIVNHHGVLVGNFSARDVRHIACSQSLFCLMQTLDVGAFCRTANLGWEEGGDGFLPPICITDADTLEHTLLLLAEKRIHRVYKVDADGKPVAVVSLTDILMALVTEPAGFAATLSRFQAASA